MLGGPAMLSDLTDDNLAKLLRWLQNTRGQSNVTANGTHKCICCFWRWARDRQLIATGPTVPPLKTPRKAPKGLEKLGVIREVSITKDAAKVTIKLFNGTATQDTLVESTLEAQDVEWRLLY